MAAGSGRGHQPVTLAHTGEGARSGARGRRSDRRALTMLGWAAAASIPLRFLLLFFVWPVIALIATGCVEEGRLSAAGFTEVMGSARSWRVITQTLLQATAATLLSVALGLP